MEKIWGETLLSLEEKVPAHMLATWFHGVKPVRMDETTFTLACPSRMSLDWINDNYRRLLEQAIAKASRRKAVQLVLTLGEPAGPPVPRRREEAAGSSGDESGSYLSSMLPPNHRRLTFERFVVGPSNEYAQGAAVAVADGSTRFNPLYLYSRVGGVGKTHLCCGIANRLLAKRPRVRVALVAAEQFIHECVSAMRKGDTEAFKKRYRNGCDILILEDVQFLTGKPRTQEELFHALDELVSGGKQVVFTGNLFPGELTDMEEGLKSRLGGGLVVEIQAPSQREREEIVKRKAAEEGIQLPPEALSLVARVATGSVRAIESALTQLLFLVSFKRKPVDLDLVREAMAPLMSRRRAPLTAEGIRDFVARQYGLGGKDLTTPSRRRNVMLPRQIGIALSRKLTPASLAVIGRAFGRDHASVVHALGSLERQMNADSQLRCQVEFLEKKLLSEFEVGGP